MSKDERASAGMAPCPWCGSDPLYRAYHDEEWGRPQYDGRALWEMLMLERFQAGLSWITILRKRENFRAAFAGFAPEQIAGWGEAEVTALLQNPGIIRHRSKITGTIRAAQLYLEGGGSGPFADLIWSVTGGQVIQSRPQQPSDVPGRRPESEALSKALIRRGYNFCGPVVCYAFMQAAGLVNDHLTSCPQHKICEALAR